MVTMSLLHCTLATRDVRATSAFFAATLNWRPIERPGNVPIPSAWLEIGPGQEIHLAEVADFQPSPFEREFGRHIAVGYPRAGFAALKERLRQHGVEPIEPARASPVERFFFRDPNGYMFEVVAVDRP